MKRYMLDEESGILYELDGDRRYPAVFTDEFIAQAGPLTKTKLLHMREHHPDQFAELVMTGKMEAYLQEFACEYREMHARIAHQLGGDLMAESMAREVMWDSE